MQKVPVDGGSLVILSADSSFPSEVSVKQSEFFLKLIVLIMANGLNGFCVKKELKLWDGLVRRGDVKRAHDGDVQIMNCVYRK